jgi:hypothetical protein
MVVVPLSQPVNESVDTFETQDSETMNWIGFAAGGTLALAGLLLLSGQRRAGMVAAASGTALALLNRSDAAGAQPGAGYRQ